MRFRIAAGFIALACASPAFAEVADKMPSVGFLWAWSLGTMALALGLALIRPWLGYLAVIHAALSAWFLHSEMTDPFVKWDILRELGQSYVDAVYLSAWIGLVGSLAIVLFFQVRRRKA